MAVETPQWIWYIYLNWNLSTETFECFGGTTELNVSNSVLVLTTSFFLLTLTLLTAVTPRSCKHFAMFSSDSHLTAVSLSITLDEFKVLCSYTATGRLKNVFSV